MTTTGLLPGLVLPRVGTPRDLSRETYGEQVGEVARRLGKPLLPHQQYIVDVALEHDGGLLSFDEVDLSIMRQMGKTHVDFCKMVWRATMAARMWGPQRITFTAQARNMARRKLERDFADALRGSPARSFREITNPKGRPSKASEWKLSLNNGAEHILFGRANYLQIDAPTSTAGHGDSLGDGNIDEAFAHQTDDVEQSMAPTMGTVFNPQLWVMSAAGDENSFYWYGKVLAGRLQIESGVPSRVCYLEWSIPDDADIDDEDVWLEFMPALGYGPGQTPPEFMRRALDRARRKVEEGGENIWRRAYGNQWPNPPIMSADRRPAKIPADKWADTIIELDEVPDERGGFPMAFGVSENSEWSSVGVAMGTISTPYGELIKHERGVGWLPKYLASRASKYKPTAIGYQQANAATMAQVSAIIEEFEAQGVDTALLQPMGAAEYRAACLGLFTDVVEGRFSRPPDQPQLDAAAGDAGERASGQGWVWDWRNATLPLTPLEVITIARALLPASRTGIFEPMFAVT